MGGLNRRGLLFAVTIVAVLAAWIASREPSVGTEEAAAVPESADVSLATEIVGVAIVADGDTIRIGTRHVRLDGIDAPVQGSMCGDVNAYRAAGNALREITDRRVVTCRISDQPDDKGRDIATCRVGETDLNEHMVLSGWARDWPLHSNGAYADEEATARAAGLGVWGPSCGANLWTPGRDYSN